MRLIRLAPAVMLAGAALLVPAGGASATSATSALSASAALPASGAAPKPVAHKAADTKAKQRSVLSYWTRSRLVNARPLDLLTPAAEGTALTVSGRPTTILPTLPQRIVRPLAFPNAGSAWTGGGAVVKTSGRVFFTFQGRTASCSGNAVTSTNKSVVMTAGHCVKLQGTFHTNWVFVPGYNNGNRPFGTWTANTLLTTPQWNANEDINFDVAAVVVNTLGGQRLTDVVGGQGIAFNQPRSQNMYAFGFPAAAPFDGERLIYCSGRTINDFLLSRDHGMRCDMTGGSSGGPWFLNFSESSGTGVQNSVNSFKYNFLPTYMFGPYFGNDARNLYNAAQSR